MASQPGGRVLGRGFLFSSRNRRGRDCFDRDRGASRTLAAIDATKPSSLSPGEDYERMIEFTASGMLKLERLYFFFFFWLLLQISSLKLNYVYCLIIVTWNFGVLGGMLWGKIQVRMLILFSY